jgi:hypothetical protein
MLWLCHRRHHSPVHFRECIYIQDRMLVCGSCHIGKINGNATSEVNMQRALWLQNGTTIVLWCAPKFSLTYLLNARRRPRRVGPCATAGHEMSKRPSSPGHRPRRVIARRMIQIDQ